MLLVVDTLIQLCDEGRKGVHLERVLGPIAVSHKEGCVGHKAKLSDLKSASHPFRASFQSIQTPLNSIPGASGSRDPPPFSGRCIQTRSTQRPNL